MQDRFSQLLRFFKAVGNEERLKILGLLALEERSVVDLGEGLEIKPSNVLRHLAAMQELGLVQVHAEDRRLYRLDTQVLEEMSKQLLSRDEEIEVLDDTSEDAWEHKVLQTFLDGDRIIDIPAQHKKRLVVLTWLANQFETGVRYPEPQMNELLGRHHPDHASLRRYLVDEGFMQREGGVYWRVQADEPSP